AYGPQNDVTLKMPAFEWVHVQLHQQKGMISLSPPTICNSAKFFGDLIALWQYHSARHSRHHGPFARKPKHRHQPGVEKWNENSR
ncbi:hypothetical protein, partial [Klebsiella pneumoniae]|uniref:hypothetical protein n=1 Tax=Klebsiella pneumoniae TaxID=573 RepID=UPI001AEF4608